MTGTPAVVARDVSKVYRRFLHQNQFKTLKSALLKGSLLSDLRPDQTFTALDGVSFEVPAGTTFGVIGENGSGKSTLLKLTAGITKPTRGELQVNGRVSALIELGAGFHPEISGRENVAINGIMLGLSRREVEERFDEIVAFAELEDFIDAPVKTYSSGMYMRLGFAVAIHVDPDVLLVDEVLAVGDEAFTRKCLDKVGEFRRRGKTIVLVTHSLGLVEKMCDEALWLRQRQGRGPRRPQARGGRVPDVRGRRRRGAAHARARPARRGGGRGRDPAPEAPVEEAGYRQGRWGSRDVEITASACSTAAARSGTSTCPARASPWRSTCVRRSRSTTSCSGSACSPRTASRSTARTPTSRTSRRSVCDGPAEVQHHASTTSGWSRAPTSWTSPRTGGTARPSTTTGASTRSG